MISESPIGEWLDNPIFVKHLRSRLRPRAIISGILIVIVLCACAIAAGFEMNGFRSGLSYSVIFALQAFLLGLLGASQVGSAVGGSRSSGVLEFHRVSPLSPAELTFGFLIGAPIREYVLFACTLPFLAVCGFMGIPTPRAIIQLLILLVFSCWVMHGLAILAALMTRKETAGRGAPGLVVLFGILIAPMILSGTMALSRLDVEYRLPLFGFSIPWLLFVLLDEAALLVFIILAALRKMRSERLHALSKPQAMAMLLAVAALVLGGMWNQAEVNLVCMILLYTLVTVSCVLTAVVTPDRAEYVKGLLRARKQGRSRVHWWNDLAWNRGFLLVVCSVVLASTSFALNVGADPMGYPAVRLPSMPLAIANGVLVVAYFGLALQYFQLTCRTHGPTFSGFFFFLIWGLPIIVGAMLASGSPSGFHAAKVVFAISPFAGIALSAGRDPDPQIAEIQFAALCPTLLFTFVFSGLAISARRRIERVLLLNFEGMAEFRIAADQASKKGPTGERDTVDPARSGESSTRA